MKTTNKLGFTFTSILVLFLLFVSVTSCKPETVTTTATITEKSTITSTVVSNVTNTITNTETITSTVTSTFTPTQTSTSQTTPSTTQSTPTTTQTTPTTSTTMTYTTGTTSVAWSADGVITEGEYSQMQQMDNNYYAYWNADDEYIYVGVKVKTEGWVGFGVNFNIMGTSEYYIYGDVVFGQFVNGEPRVYDGYVFASSTWAVDTVFGADDDLLDWGMTRADGYTIMEFKRVLDTGDEVYDTAYKPGESNYILWVYNSNDKMLAWPTGGIITLTI